MKALGTALKIIAALVAIAGIVYVVIHYGDRIAAWVKMQLSKFGCCRCGESIAAVYPEEAAPEEAIQAEETDFEG